MEEECSIIEEVWKIVEKVSSEKDLACRAESLKLVLVNVVAQSPPSEEVEHEEAGVEEEAEAGYMDVRCPTMGCMGESRSTARP